MLESTRFYNLATKPPLRVRVAEIAGNGAASRAGPPILVVPGWMGDVDRFLDLGRALARIGPVLIWEPHGFGRSRAPHRRGLFGAESYVAEMERLLAALELRDRQFVILGASSGASLALHYHLDGRGPKPAALVLFSPQLEFRVPGWFAILDALPSAAARAAQGAVLRLLRSYLRLARPGDARNVDYAMTQLARWDDWALRKFLLEYMRRCDLSERVCALDVPVIAFAGERDWFASHPEPGLLRVPGSRLEVIAGAAHRFQDGREHGMADSIAAALAGAAPGLFRPAGAARG